MMLKGNGGRKNAKQRWIYLLIMAFVVGVLTPFLLRAHEKYQRLKTAKQFAYAVQLGDFQRATQLVLVVERQQLNVNPDTMRKAFELLKMPRLQFVSLGKENLTEPPPTAYIRSMWQLPEGQRETVILEMMREEGRWRINFFSTFQRFCALKLRLQGWDKVKAFYESHSLATQILRSVGIKGYVSDFGTIQTFEGEKIGVLTP